MTNVNMTSEFIFGASERELLTLSIAEIIDGLMADYRSFSKSNDAGIRIPEKKQEPRMSHSCILYVEALRLAHTHLELAKKLMLASLYDFSVQVGNMFVSEDEDEETVTKTLAEIFEEIAKSSHYSTRPFSWLKDNGESKLLEKFLKEIKDFEDFKAAEREREEEEKSKRGMAG